MPTSYLTKLSKELDIPEDELEEKWQRAKELANKSDPENKYAYATKILQNMLSISAGKTKKIPDWWKNMGEKAREQYLKTHPKSRFHGKTVAPVKSKVSVRKQPKGEQPQEEGTEDLQKPAEPHLTEAHPNEEDLDSQEEQEQEEVDELDRAAEPETVEDPLDEEEEPEEDEDEQEDLGVTKYEPEEKAVRTAALEKAQATSSAQIEEEWETNKQGAAGIEKLLEEQEPTPVEEAKAKKLSMNIGKALIAGALLAAVAFSPLGSVAYGVGLLYYDYMKEFGQKDEDEKSESSDDLDDAPKQLSYKDRFVQGMSKWIAEQDPQELADEVEDKYGQLVDGV